MRAGTVRFWLRATMAALALLIGPPAGYVAWDNLVANNFGPIEQGRLYRSAQLSAHALTRVVRDHHIKTLSSCSRRSVIQC